MKTKHFRITIFISGHEFVGKWRVYALEDLQRNVMAYAENEQPFMVEFSEMEEQEQK